MQIVDYVSEIGKVFRRHVCKSDEKARWLSAVPHGT